MKTLDMIPFDCDRTCPAHETAVNGLFLCRFLPLLSAVGRTVVHSHVAKIKCDITDLDRLEAAVKLLGLELTKKPTYKWYGHHVGDYPLPEGFTKEQLGKCDYAISVPGNSRAYEIGVVRRKDGSGFDLLWDFWARGYGLQDAVGDGCSKLIEAYTFSAVQVQAQALGWQTEQTPEGLLVHHPSGGTITVTPTSVMTNGFTGGACHAAREQLGLQVDPDSVVNTAECDHIPAVVTIQK